MQQCRIHGGLYGTMTLLAVLLGGCGGNANSSDSDLAKAQTALDNALDAWTRGEPPEKFAVVDPDWKAGCRLLSFLTADAQLLDADSKQVRCRVALTLKDRDGRKQDKEVTYLIQLGNTIGIRRDSKK